MNLFRKSTFIAALPAVAATPALAHDGHASFAAAVHGPLHLLMILGSVFGAGAIAYFAVRAVHVRRSAESTIH